MIAALGGIGAYLMTLTPGAIFSIFASRVKRTVKSDLSPALLVAMAVAVVVIGIWYYFGSAISSAVREGVLERDMYWRSEIETANSKIIEQQKALNRLSSESAAVEIERQAKALAAEREARLKAETALAKITAEGRDLTVPRDLVRTFRRDK